MVRIQDGAIVAIGGLMQLESNRSVSWVYRAHPACQGFRLCLAIAPTRAVRKK